MVIKYNSILDVVTVGHHQTSNSYVIITMCFTVYIRF